MKAEIFAAEKVMIDDLKWLHPANAIGMVKSSYNNGKPRNTEAGQTDRPQNRCIRRLL